MTSSGTNHKDILCDQSQTSEYYLKRDPATEKSVGDMDLNRLEDGKQEDRYFEDEDDDTRCGEVEFSPAKQTRVDEEEYWDEEDDSWCREMALPSPKRARLEEEEEEEEPVGEEQVGGAGPLFQFTLRGGTLPRRWKNVVNKTRHTARLEQLRDAEGEDQLGAELTAAVQRALASAIDKQEKELRGTDRVHFTMQATAFAQGQNNCFQSTQFEVEEIRDGGPRLTTYLQQLAKQLNSSQSISPGDDFSLDVTTIRMSESGGKLKKYDPAKALVRGIVKKTRISIKNKDELCCARAIVTMKAYADERANVFPPIGYKTLRDRWPAQERLARELLREAGVGEGSCGLPELSKFQTALPDYQIKVMRVGRPHMIVFAGPDRPRRILLLLEDGHYDGCTSYGGWLNKCYYCHECDRGFDRDDLAHHPCNGRRCTSCHSLECEDFLAQKR